MNLQPLVGAEHVGLPFGIPRDAPGITCRRRHPALAAEGLAAHREPFHQHVVQTNVELMRLA